MMVMRIVLLLLATLFLVSVHPAAMADNTMNHAVSESGQTGHDVPEPDGHGKAVAPCCQGTAANQAGDAHCPADCAGLIPVLVVMAFPSGAAVIGETPPGTSSPVPQTLLKPPIPV